jgi:hypothetical protein
MPTTHVLLPTARSLRPSRPTRDAKTDLTLTAGRLHYSLGFPPSAQFRGSFEASEHLDIAS